MGKVYKDKKSKGCALCKPHKHGWAPKKKAKTTALEKEMDREINKERGKGDGSIKYTKNPSQNFYS